MPTVNEMLFNPPQETQEDNRSKSEIKLEYLIKQGFTRENIEMKTDLSSPAIKAIAKGKMHAQIFNDQTMDDLATIVMVLNVSKDRKGRGELTEFTRTLNNQDETDNDTVLSRLLG